MKNLLTIALLSFALMIAPASVAVYAQDATTVTTDNAGTVESVDTINLTEESAVVVSEGADVTSDTTVVVPIGNWVSELLTSGAALIGSLALAAFAWFLRKIPKAVADALRVAQVEQIIQRGVDYGISAVAGATKDKALTVDVGSKVLAQAANYAVQQAPAWFLGFVGGPENLRQMILARLKMDSTASAQSMDVLPPQAIE